MLISDLKGLTVRTVNVLKCENITTLGELLNCSHVDLLKMPNMGKKSAQEISDAVQQLGFHLQGERTASTQQVASARLPFPDMSLRDFFAAKALQGMISTAGAPCLLGLEGGESETAKAAYKLADAMLAARSA